MKTRRHHNNKGLSQIKRGKTEEQVRNIAKRLSIPYGDRRPLTQKEMKQAAKNRSPNYENLSPQEQWEEDRRLGILDWDGK